MFKTRSLKAERIDTGDYTPEEYATFLREIRFINQRLGDRAALEKTLLAEITRVDLKEFSVLDVGAGSGELLRSIVNFVAKNDRKAQLTGIDLNEISVAAMRTESHDFPNISPVRGDALSLPFADDSFDYAISSLFFHHLTDDQIVAVLKEMSRVARRGIVVIDLERNQKAWFLYQLFCLAYRISPLVRQDGSLSIRKGFRVQDLQIIGEKVGLPDFTVTRSAPYRVVLFSNTRY